MDLFLLLSFLGASILLTLLPGPDILYVITESIINGSKTGISIAFGLVSGVLLHTTLAATGLSVIIYQSNFAFNMVKYAGAAYLFYLAFQASKEQLINLDFNNRKSAQAFQFFPLFRKGWLMNVLNPKISVFFIAFLPKFIHPNGWQPVYQMFFLGLIFILQAILIFVLVSFLAGRLTKYLQNPKFWQVTKWIKTFVLALIGLSLFVT